MQLIENNQRRPESIASFCRVFLDYAYLVAPEFLIPNGNVNGARPKLALQRLRLDQNQSSTRNLELERFRGLLRAMWQAIPRLEFRSRNHL